MTVLTTGRVLEAFLSTTLGTLGRLVGALVGALVETLPKLRL
ncbi:MAG: hypothetical protein ACOC2Z_08595 [Coleofasciculus sp.]